MSKQSCNGQRARASCAKAGCRIPRECLHGAMAHAERERAHAIGDLVAAAIGEAAPLAVMGIGIAALLTAVLWG